MILSFRAGNPWQGCKIGPRTDWPDYVKSLGTFDSPNLQIAAAEHYHWENHIIRRALALHWHERGEGSLFSP